MTMLHHVIWFACLCYSCLAQTIHPCTRSGFWVNAECQMTPDPSFPSLIAGSIKLEQFYNPWCEPSKLVIDVSLTGVPYNDDNPNRKHGLHVHEKGNISWGCNYLGSHFNPEGSTHGALRDVKESKHAGDFGNVEADAYGTVNQQLIERHNIDMLYKPRYNIIGRSIVLHRQQDDLGKGGDSDSLKTGNSGERIACCTIEPVPIEPID